MRDEVAEHEVVEHLVGRGRGRQDGEREHGRLDQAGSVSPARSRALVSAPPTARRKLRGTSRRRQDGGGRRPRISAKASARAGPLDRLERAGAARATSWRGGRPSSLEGSAVRRRRGRPPSVATAGPRAPRRAARGSREPRRRADASSGSRVSSRRRAWSDSVPTTFGRSRQPAAPGGRCRSTVPAPSGGRAW